MRVQLVFFREPSHPFQAPEPILPCFADLYLDEFPFPDPLLLRHLLRNAYDDRAANFPRPYKCLGHCQFNLTFPRFYYLYLFVIYAVLQANQAPEGRKFVLMTESCLARSYSGTNLVSLQPTSV